MSSENNENMACITPRPQAAVPPSCDFTFSDDEAKRLLRAISDALLVQCHYQLYVWLSGELQRLLPHDILVSAWGDFGTGHVKLDVISSLPGVRTQKIVACQLKDVVQACHRLWLEGGREARLLLGDRVLPANGCSCAVHRAIWRMRSVLVHGLTDARTGHDSIYIAFAAAPQAQGRSKEKFLKVANALLPQIDFAFRKVVAFQMEDESPSGFGPDSERPGLSVREREILDQICQGKTNAEIGSALGISRFTVKNHVQRIFRKIGVTNRTEAATRFHRGMNTSAVGGT